MAHFAELDSENKVLRVIVVSDNDAPTEAQGAAFCGALLGGRWIQTSYNARIRGKFAGIGDAYDPVADVFTQPQTEGT